MWNDNRYFIAER